MVRFSFTLLLVLNSSFLFSQIGLINDPDGYTNLRKEETTKSEILYQIKENEVFFFLEEFSDSESNWIQVYIPSINLYGYIHRSRLMSLEELPETDDDVSLTFEITNADSVDYGNYGDAYGLEIPLSMSFAISNMTLNWKGTSIPQEVSTFAGLYNMYFTKGTFTDNLKTYKNNDTYFIFQKCGDGAGYYEVVWVITDGKIIQRLAGTIY